MVCKRCFDITIVALQKISLCTTVHVVTKRTRRVCEGDYYLYTKK